MEPAIVRLCAVVALVFLFLGDFSTIVNPMLNSLGYSSNAKTKRAPRQEVSSSDENEKEALALLAATTAAKNSLMVTIRNSCLPKLICELNATPNRERLTDAEKSLMSLIKDTSISMTAEVTSKYHFAAHMGQLIAGVDGAGCHNFYPLCPFPGMKILQMMKKVKIR